MNNLVEQLVKDPGKPRISNYKIQPIINKEKTKEEGEESLWGYNKNMIL